MVHGRQICYRFCIVAKELLVLPQTACIIPTSAAADLLFKNDDELYIRQIMMGSNITLTFQKKDLQQLRVYNKE